MTRMKGTYALLIKLPEEQEIQIGKLGRIRFQKGFFAYIGSALNGLEQRIGRHLRKEKRFHWHIDFLLEKAKICRIVYSGSPIRKECVIAGTMLKNLGRIEGFGCSDCKCKSHLFYCKDLEELQKVVLDAFRENGVAPVVMEQPLKIKEMDGIPYLDEKDCFRDKPS